MASRFWVGGTASWDATAGSKWSLTSGGTGGQAVPTTSDNVFFDANSGANTVTLAATGNSLSLDFTGFTGTFTGFQVLNVLANLTVGSGMTFGTGFDASFNAASGSFTITTNGINLGTSSGIAINNTSSYTLVGDLVLGSNGLSLGTSTSFNANNYNVTTGYLIQNSGGGGGSTTMGSGLWTISSANGFAISATVGTVSAASTVIKFTDTSNTATTFLGGSHSFGTLWFARGGSTGNITVSGSNTFGTLQDTGTAAHSILFTAGTAQTLTNWSVSGNSGNLITLNSTTTATFSLSKASGTATSDYLNIQHSVATGGAAWYAGVNSVNNQSVSTAGSGWIFSAGPSASASAGFFTLISN